MGLHSLFHSALTSLGLMQGGAGEGRFKGKGGWVVLLPPLLHPSRPHAAIATASRSLQIPKTAYVFKTLSFPYYCTTPPARYPPPAAGLPDAHRQVWGTHRLLGGEAAHHSLPSASRGRQEPAGQPIQGLRRHLAAGCSILLQLS